MSLEFTKLSEAEQIETVSDKATVLIEDNGEIKRAPKKEVGGAGGYIATYTASDMESDIDWGGIVLSENYDELYNVLSAGGSAWIDFTEYTNATSTLVTPSPTYTYTTRDKIRASIIYWFITDIGLVAQCLVENEPVDCLFPNGSYNLES